MALYAMHGTSRLTGLGLALLAVGCLAGGWAGRAFAAAAAGEVVIGAVLDLSGPGAAEGKEARDALFVELERANRAGGGVAGRGLVLLGVDTGGRPAQVAEAVQALAREPVAVAVFGPAGIPAARAAAREAGRQ
ncbi:MAG: ABC transporter substrate-binding protein, partial [Candidatus Tectomicrobia bacterium]|nr:ABC transporter substrate-binding protein [Candidatus Tectomicrobia bacterium]